MIMNPDTILQADLLDIIFEHRNKDYGAYALRKEYNSSLRKALLAMFALVLIITGWQFLKKNKPFKNIISFTADSTRTLEEPPKQKPLIPKPVQPLIRIATIQDPPIIVDDPLVQTPPPTVEQIQISGTGKPQEGEPTITNINVIPGDNTTGVLKNIVPEKLAIDKTKPTESPDVMPQYPGGINELIKFLKKNLKAPDEINENDEISVKVRFVVNYDGSLIGFDVIQSGGAIFDNEVIRVLKKMPRWVPGKTSGENVSVYFIIPVKFNVE